MEISIVIPVLNEEDTLCELHARITDSLSLIHKSSYEIIFIDDGSYDSSWEIIRALSVDFPNHVRAIKLRRNCGKAAALSAGFDAAIGEIVFTMDADLQDDPFEIPHFLEKLNQGFDLVSGWKKNRHDPWTKVVPSMIFNFFTRRFTKLNLHDFNCGFKAYRKEVLQNIQLYGELHRFIPALAYNLGFKVGEIPVNHNPRHFGKSKYGFERFSRGFLDLLTILLLTNYLQRPGHLFGGVGIAVGLVGSISLIYLVILWLLGDRPIGDRPLLIFGIMAVILSVQLISLGLLAELNLRNTRKDHVKDYIQETAGFEEVSRVTITQKSDMM
jgi:glycosyltransferase involved in cell wall biosynthesis